MAIRILDNEGKTLDRYTVIINNEVYTMCDEPLSCMGVNQYSGDIDYLGFSNVDDFVTHCEMTGHNEITFDDLNDNVCKAIGQRIADASL